MSESPSHDNVKITANILSDERMRKIGFTDHNPQTWYYCRIVPGTQGSISFNVSIPKDGSDIEIVTLDEDFLQPYNFVRILSRTPEFQFALNVKDFVEQQMTYLQDSGVLNGYRRGEYI